MPKSIEKGLLIEINGSKGSTLDATLNFSILQIHQIGEISPQEAVVSLCVTLMNLTLTNGMSKEDLKDFLNGMIDEIDEIKHDFNENLH